MSEQDWSWQDKIPMPSDEDHKKFLDNIDKYNSTVKEISIKLNQPIYYRLTADGRYIPTEIKNEKERRKSNNRFMFNFD